MVDLALDLVVTSVGFFFFNTETEIYKISEPSSSKDTKNSQATEFKNISNAHIWQMTCIDNIEITPTNQ